AMASFFFQAEDGIRDFHVTGVQTCALPIYSAAAPRAKRFIRLDTPARAAGAAQGALLSRPAPASAIADPGRDKRGSARQSAGTGARSARSIASMIRGSSGDVRLSHEPMTLP